MKTDPVDRDALPHCGNVLAKVRDQRWPPLDLMVWVASSLTAAGAGSASGEARVSYGRDADGTGAGWAMSPTH
jgi:hypothetical protein